MARCHPFLGFALGIGLAFACGSTDNDFRPLNADPRADADPNRPDAAINETSFRVANFNAQNLLAPGSTTDKGPVTEAGYREKVSDVAKVVDALSADVVVFQEVEKETALDDVIAATRDGAAKYTARRRRGRRSARWRPSGRRARSFSRGASGNRLQREGSVFRRPEPRR